MTIDDRRETKPSASVDGLTDADELTTNDRFADVDPRHEMVNEVRPPTADPLSKRSTTPQTHSHLEERYGASCLARLVHEARPFAQVKETRRPQQGFPL